MSKAELRKKAGLSSATFTRLRKNEEVNLSVILKIADVPDCNAGDMMDFVKVYCVFCYRSRRNRPRDHG